jgi:hypothetical protein
MMRNLKMMLLLLATMAILPGIASATHITGVEVNADCDGWWAQLDVYWRTGIYTGDLDYTISLVDQDANILEQVSWAGPISRAVSDPRAMSYTFSGSWSGTFQADQFSVTGMFHLVSPWDGGVDDETVNASTVFECSVATENSTWSTIKALYR